MSVQSDTDEVGPTAQFVGIHYIASSVKALQYLQPDGRLYEGNHFEAYTGSKEQRESTITS
jgi:hypothetical protein